MKAKLTIQEKKKLLKFILLGNEFKFEISYSKKYLQKILTILKNKSS